MTKTRTFVTALALASLACMVGLISPAFFSASAQAQAASGQNVAKKVGTIKVISGSVITLTPDSGAEITVNVQPTARILKLASGDKDLKNATPIQLQDLQVGDTIRVRGFAANDATTIPALEIVVITHSAVAAVSDQIRQDWQKRGMGGLVDSVDAASGNVTVSVPSMAGKKTIVIHTMKATVVRRYSPDSIKFEDATPSTLQQIQQGDQLRARGEHNTDGTEFNAEEIITGSFPYIVGTIKSVDASAGTLSVQDILSKKTVQVKTTSDSQLHKIPAEVAQRFAARLKGGGSAGAPGANASGGSTAGANAPGSSSQPANNSAQSQPSGQAGPGGARSGGGGMGGGKAPDFQQLLSRLPASTLADLQLQKGDAVVILATQGTPTTASTAITLLSGVEPILQAAPNATQAMMLTPWSLGGAPGGDAGSQ
jgi:hypothetical protein